VWLGMGFWVGEEVFQLKMKAGEAWDGVLGGCGSISAQGECG
jgi:hypothetical protein